MVDGRVGTGIVHDEFDREGLLRMGMFGSSRKRLPMICVYSQREKDNAVLHEKESYFTDLLRGEFNSTHRTSPNNLESAYLLESFKLAEGGELKVFRLNGANPTSGRLEKCVDGLMYLLENVPKKSPITELTVLDALRKLESHLLLEVNNLPPAYPFIRTALGR